VWWAIVYTQVSELCVVNGSQSSTFGEDHHVLFNVREALETMVFLDACDTISLMLSVPPCLVAYSLPFFSCHAHCVLVPFARLQPLLQSLSNAIGSVIRVLLRALSATLH
jgi:hypothetical protein